MEGPHGVQSEIQSRDDAEVAAAAADRPEQVLVPAGPEFQYLAVGGHELRPDHIVARRPEEAAPSRITAGERQARNADVTAAAHRRDEPGGQRGGEQILDPRAASNRRDTAVRINADGVERGEVDLQRAVGDPESGIAVPAPADRDGNAVSPRELHAAPHVVNVRAARHRERATIVGEIPDSPRLVEERRPVPKETPTDLSGEIVEVGRRRSRYRARGAPLRDAGTQRERRQRWRSRRGRSRAGSNPGCRCDAWSSAVLGSRGFVA